MNCLRFEVVGAGGSWGRVARAVGERLHARLSARGAFGGGRRGSEWETPERHDTARITITKLIISTSTIMIICAVQAPCLELVRRGRELHRSSIKGKS